jgi:tRNA (guanine37-N1)-methyltransferase
LLEFPQFTRPLDYRGLAVPEVLRGGNHAQIDTWRAEQALERTRVRRPDLAEALSPAPVGQSAAEPAKRGEPR